MEIRVKRLDSEIPLPEYKTPGAVAFDLHVREGAIIPPNETRLLPTGLIIAVPDGHALILASRSSNAKRLINLTNGIGVIDRDYCGNDDELFLAIHNVGPEPYEVKRLDRVAQGLIVPVPTITFTEVEDMGETSRGGFGTTGR